MEKKQLIINVVFGVCLVVLFVLHFTSKGSSSDQVEFAVTDSTGTTTLKSLPIAYVNVDSLLLNYNYSKDLNDVLIKKRENAQATLTQKARQLDAEMGEQQSLLKKQQDLQKLEQTLTQQLMEDQQVMNKQLRDTIYSFLKSYNLDKKYQVILSNTMNDNVMIANPKLDITEEVIKLLNKNYVPKED
jgi:outer membrane protein